MDRFSWIWLEINYHPLSRLLLLITKRQMFRMSWLCSKCIWCTLQIWGMNNWMRHESIAAEPNEMQCSATDRAPEFVWPLLNVYSMTNGKLHSIRWYDDMCVAPRNVRIYPARHCRYMIRSHWYLCLFLTLPCVNSVFFWHFWLCRWIQPQSV